MPQEDKKHIFSSYWRALAGQDAPEPVGEFVFGRPRRFRFDWAFPEHKVAVEIDGGSQMVVMGKRGLMVGGRHNTDKDRVKGNLAAALGWRVLHYTPSMVAHDPLTVVNQVRACLGLKETKP